MSKKRDIGEFKELEQELQPKPKIQREEWMDEPTDPRKRIVYEEVYPEDVEVQPSAEPNPVPAKVYPFKLDPFQKKAIDCLERNESVLVSAHTSAGKTAVAEYAIAMGLRDHQRVIYTSPIKALSNQKYRDLEEEFSDVGLMTGDVTINPNATVLVMTTEILRSMLYRGNEILREVAWVIFDEIHYMRDKERGVVWEETIILLPDKVRFVFLSATIPNAKDFAGWIAKIHKQKMNVVYTEYRPTPLQHYLFPVGGDGLHLVVDDKGKFREQNFIKAMAALNTSDLDKEILDDKRSQKMKKNTSDIIRIISMVMEKNLDPVIVFSFSKKDCETYSVQLAKMDFTTEEEKQSIQEIYKNAISSLSAEDRNLPQVKSVLPLLARGVGIHHGGLLPILKETIEILFQEGLIKILFATETFAMGINMPAKTCIFTGLRKYDGSEYRFISPGEYIQMSGRAGRRNKDDKGIVIVMVAEQNCGNDLKHILCGTADPLNSSFHLGYNMLLNLMRVEDADPVYMIKNSFYQYQAQLNTPDMNKEVTELQQQIEDIHIEDEKKYSTIFSMREALKKLTNQIQYIVMNPKYALPFIQPGRLVKVQNKDTDFGWGAIVNFKKNKDIKEEGDDYSKRFIIDVCLKCGEKSTIDQLLPYEEGSNAPMQVVSVYLPSITALSAVKTFMPKDLRAKESRATVTKTVKEILKRFPNGVPLLDPTKDMGLSTPDFIKLTQTRSRVQSNLQKIEYNPGDKEAEGRYNEYIHKNELIEKQKTLKKNIRDAQEIQLVDTLEKMMRVLRRLGCITEEGVITKKGRVACEINTADELLVTELIYDGVFIDLTPEQSLALLSSIVFQEKSEDTGRVRMELQQPYEKLLETARRIATVFNECKIQIDVEEYVGRFKPGIMDVTYEWVNGAKFADICNMTTIFEGTIIRCIRRLEELVEQVEQGLKDIGDITLAKKFEEGSKKTRRDIVFAASLYT
ncbi:hypothetical protein WA158_005717 [Blastocystis sp. Blastoise]